MAKLFSRRKLQFKNLFSTRALLMQPTVTILTTGSINCYSPWPFMKLSQTFLEYILNNTPMGDIFVAECMNLTSLMSLQRRLPFTTVPKIGMSLTNVNLLHNRINYRLCIMVFLPESCRRLFVWGFFLKYTLLAFKVTHCYLNNENIINLTNNNVDVYISTILFKRATFSIFSFYRMHLTNKFRCCQK